MQIVGCPMRRLIYEQNLCINAPHSYSKVYSYYLAYVSNIFQKHSRIENVMSF